MLSKVIRYGIAALLVGGSIGLSEAISQNMIRAGAEQFYEGRGYDPNRNIEFPPESLERYTTQAAVQANRGSTLATTAILLFASGGAGLICTFDPKKADARRQQFKQWLAAVQANDSLKVAQIETEVRDGGGS